MSHTVTLQQPQQTEQQQPPEDLFLVLTTAYGRNKLEMAKAILERIKKVEEDKKKKSEALYEKANRINAARVADAEEQRKRLLAVAKARKDSTLPISVDEVSERVNTLGEQLSQTIKSAQEVASALASNEQIFQQQVDRVDNLAGKI